MYSIVPLCILNFMVNRKVYKAPKDENSPITMSRGSDAYTILTISDMIPLDSATSPIRTSKFLEFD
jgi:hypothetical protein